LGVDGYAGLAGLVEARKDASVQLAFCWAHARRPFYEFYTSTASPLAAEVLARIGKFYEIEAESRGNRLMCGRQFGSDEVARWSRNCTNGYKTTCRVCLAGRIWRKPCATHCGTGAGGGSQRAAREAVGDSNEGKPVADSSSARAGMSLTSRQVKHRRCALQIAASPANRTGLSAFHGNSTTRS
jgi:hypothetical protein